MRIFASQHLSRLSLMLASSLLATAALAQNYGKPQVVVPPSNFKGVHGLAVDNQGRL